MRLHMNKLHCVLPSLQLNEHAHVRRQVPIIQQIVIAIVPFIYSFVIKQGIADCGSNV